MNEPIKEKYNIKKEKKGKLRPEDYYYWWDNECPNPAASMVDLVKTIQENQKYRQLLNIKHGFLYTNRHNELVGVSSSLPENYSVTYNVVKSCVDTVAAKIAQDKPRPRILTEAGDNEQQTRAKNLTKYLDGVFLSAQTYTQAAQAFKDSAVFGTGILKVLVDANNNIKTERVLVNEIVVDDLEGSYADPQSMYQVKYVSKYTLMQQYPHLKNEIASAGSDDPDDSKRARVKTVDMVKVYEGWHLGENPRHLIALDDVPLINEPWKINGFPFAIVRYNNSIASFYGIGVAEELMGTQLEINKILRDIQRAQNLIAVPRVLMEYNSKVVAGHLNNEMGSAIKYQGTKPDFFTPTAMNNEIYSHVKWLIQTAYEKVGISQLSATSKKPGGLDSGKALREYQDIESERFTLTQDNYKNFFLDIGHLIINISRALYKDKSSIPVKVDGRRFIETIDWKNVSLDDDKYIMKMYSSNLFPTQPAAKIQKIEEYVRAGWISRESAIDLFDFPDVEAWETLETSNKAYMDKIIGDILGEGKYTPPEPEMQLLDDINIMKKAYIDALRANISQDRAELFLRWIEQAAGMLPPPPPAATPMVVGPASPELAPAQANPLPLPQTGMLPQV